MMMGVSTEERLREGDRKRAARRVLEKVGRRRDAQKGACVGERVPICTTNLYESSCESASARVFV